MLVIMIIQLRHAGYYDHTAAPYAGYFDDTAAHDGGHYDYTAVQC